jgi:hypothetical protein
MGMMLLNSCKKREATDWDTNLLGPLFSTSLGIDKLLPDSIKQVNSDNSIDLVYDNTFSSTGFVNTQKLPDTAIVKFFTIPFGSIFLNAGDNFLDLTEETKLNFSPLALSKLIVKTGEIEVDIINKITQLNCTWMNISIIIITINKHTITIPIPIWTRN